jgi:AAA domain
MATRIQAARSLSISNGMPRVTAQQPHPLSLEARPNHDGFESDGPGHLSQRGPRHDNDHVNFQDIQILPTTDEVLAVQRPPYMPKKNIQERSYLEAGPQRLLDTLFRHLRHDSIEGIRDVAYHAAQYLAHHNATAVDDPEPRQETPSGNRYFLYPNVKFEEVLSDEKRGIILRVSYSCPKFMRGRAMIRSGRLEEGMLCALACLGEDGNSLSVTFFEVFMTQSTDSMLSRDGRGARAAVQLAFARPAKHDDIQRSLRYAQGLSSGQYALVEFPKLLYAGFYHCLSTLQQIKSTGIAFTQYIAPRITTTPAASTSVTNSATTAVSPPAYCTLPDFRFNMGCLAQNKASFSLSQIQQKGGKDFMHFLKQNTTLDEGQALALKDCLTREVAFTQGPPGTGKTYLGIALSRVLLASRSTANRKPILVVCLTNHALDSFLGGLVEAGVTKVARIGRGSKEEWIKKFELRTLTRNTRMSQLAWEKKMMAVRDAQTLFTEIEAGCKGLNAEAATGSLSWPTVEAYLRTTHREVYQQLTTSNDNPYAHSFAFDYWSGGGDLRNLRELRTELETCLMGSSANDGSSISTQGIDRALEQITIHAQQQSARAEQKNIWKGSLEERQQMLRSWKAEIDREELIEHFSTLQTDHQSAGEAIRKTWYQRDAKCLLEQDVIGLTTTACASNWEMLKTLDLEIVICEEAGEVMEAHTVCSLFPSVQHAIFIGDPQQLRPDVNEQKMSLETAVGSRYRLDESLFERCMVPTDPKSRPMPTSHLNIQRRMHPDIADIPRLIYPYLKDHVCTSLHPSTKGIAERMFWIDHRMPEADSGAASKSHNNPYEVATITGMVQHLIKGNAYSLGDVAVLTPYNGQLAALHESLKTTCSVWLSEKDRKALLDDGLLEEAEEDKPRVKNVVNISDLLRVATVDNFQGEEAKIVILSTVRSGGRPGFLKTMNRINVACSRARDGFYIVGNSETLGQVPMWRQIIDIFAARGRVSSRLRICCPRHPDHHRDITTPQDFNRFQECRVACGETLPCGHSCQERCHPPELHERLPCMTPCEKVHPCGHRCLKFCSEACGPCKHPIQQHALPCGHSVNILCSGGVPACAEVIEDAPLPCGHQHNYRCCDKDKPYYCEEMCGQLLSCGHPCQGFCADCRASTTGSHRPCSAKCAAKFSNCGHHCDSECHPGSPCPPCKQPCEESCAHGRCKNVCSEDCNPCVKPHKRSCTHQVQSSLLCSLPSDVLPCSEHCDKGESIVETRVLNTV